MQTAGTGQSVNRQRLYLSKIRYMTSRQPAFTASESALLTGLGARLRAARLRRRLSSEVLAQRAGISRMTLFRAEKGESAVALGTYLRILQVLRMEDQLALVAKDDELGMRIQDAAAPRRGTGVQDMKGFRSAAEMSESQHDRELAEALKVQAMPASTFSRWLQSNWGRLQDEANKLYAQVGLPASGPRAVHFRTPEEKNRFDRERETAFALQVAAAQD
jgi:transcriptional regulator with XRE-family HTH domain